MHNYHKFRGAWLVPLFTILTFGIYWLFWYYSVNKEVMDHASVSSTYKIKCSLGLVVLSQFVPIANLVSNYNTVKRLQIIKNICKDPDSISATAAVLFAIFLPFGIYSYMVQSALNSHWRYHGFSEEGEMAAPSQTNVQGMASPSTNCVYCSGCGSSLDLDAQFCGECGNRVC